jgi:hypothetical protein
MEDALGQAQSSQHTCIEAHETSRAAGTTDTSRDFLTTSLVAGRYDHFKSYLCETATGGLAYASCGTRDNCERAKRG